MIKSMKTVLLIAIPLTIAITGCGVGSSGDGGNPTPENPKNQENIEAEESKFNYDLTQMSRLNAVYTDSSGEAPLWYTRISVNGDEVSKQEGVGIEDLKAALGAISFKNYDVVRTEITVKGTNESILATNLKKVAAIDEKLGKIWNDECSFIDEPEHEISDTDYEFIDGENRLVMKVDICDFYGFSLKPVMQIKPQKKNLAKKLVIYHCAFEPDNISTSQSSPYIEKYSGDTPCGYGYETLPGEQAPKVEILKDYAPGTALYNAKLLRFDDVKLSLGNAGQFLLSTDFYNPPFGSLTACHTIKLDVKFANDAGIQLQRLTFKRSNQAGGVTWMPQESSSWPSMHEIAKYYKSSANEKMHLYRFCDWIPEARDLEGGNVITIETN